MNGLISPTNFMQEVTVVPLEVRSDFQVWLEMGGSHSYDNSSGKQKCLQMIQIHLGTGWFQKNKKVKAYINLRNCAACKCAPVEVDLWRLDGKGHFNRQKQRR